MNTKARVGCAVTIMVALAAAAQALLNVKVNLSAPITLTQPLGTDGSVSCTFTGKFKHIGNAKFAPGNYTLGVSDTGSNTYQVSLTLDGVPLNLNVIE